MPPWVPIPYYYKSPLANLPAPTNLPHKLGFIPKYLSVKKDELRSKA